MLRAIFADAGVWSVRLRAEFAQLIQEKTGVTPLNESEKSAIKIFLQADKKNTGSQVTYSLPSGIGQGVFGVRPEAKGAK